MSEQNNLTCTTFIEESGEFIVSDNIFGCFASFWQTTKITYKPFNATEKLIVIVCSCCAKINLIQVTLGQSLHPIADQLGITPQL